MKLAFLILLVAVAACASERRLDATLPAASETAPPAAQGTVQESTETRSSNPAPLPDATKSPVDLSGERALLDESEAARKASDYATARAKAAQAVALLVTRPEVEQDAAWLAHLEVAGHAARDAYDTRTAQTASQLVCDIRSHTLPEEHPDLQNARHDLAASLYQIGDLAAARVLQEKVLEVRSRTLPDHHPDLQAARVSLGNTLNALGEDSATRKLFEKALAVSERTLPDNHPDLQRARVAVGITLKHRGDLPGAREMFEKALLLMEGCLPDDHPYLQRARQHLSETLFRLGDLPGARALCQKVLEVYSRMLPDEHRDLQWAREALADTLHLLGDFVGARVLRERVLVVRSRTLPDDHRDLHVARGNLAITLYALGDLASARALYEKVLEVRTRTRPDDHPDLQRARQGLAATLYTLGDLAATRALMEKVLEISSRTLPDDHPDLQAARGNLACTLWTLGDLAAARALQEKVLEVFLRTLPDDHPDLQKTRHNLAAMLCTLGDLAAVRALREKVLEVFLRTLPEDHPDLQKARQGLAVTLRTLGDLAAARALMEKVLEVSSRTLPDDHPDLQAARGNLAVTLAVEHAVEKEGEKERKGKEEGGREEFARLANSFTRAIACSTRTAVLTASSREAEERCANALADLGLALSFAGGLGVFESDPRLEREAFVLSEQTRGVALAWAYLSRRASADPRYGMLREAMRTASEELARLAQQGANANEVGRARSAREAAERDLAQLARAFSGSEAGFLGPDPTSLSAALSEGDALVGYRRYTRWAHEPGGGLEPESTESLCAFVLRSGDRLKRTELGPIEPIEQAASRWREAVGVGLERGVGVRASDADEQGRRGTELRSLVFDPLLPALGEADHLIIALDDVMHLVPLDALPAPDGQGCVGERWRIDTRATLTEIEVDPAQPTEGVLMALGGASFNSAPLALSADETPKFTKQDPTSTAGILRGTSWERGFQPLTYTRDEARGVAQLHGEVYGERQTDLVLEGRKASRSAVEELAPRARFVHIATHGWFAPESIRSSGDSEPLDVKSGLGVRLTSEEQVRGMSPMLLCGLALAGANLPEDEVGHLPGLITAEEISTLDLSNCELAVLSACDTNVGVRRAGQGVASLQKAFQMAGAHSVITSLWKVRDEVTKDLMLDFYRRLWVEKKPKWQALWEAKMKIRNAKDEAGKPKYSTRDWAAWVLTGSPE